MLWWPIEIPILTSGLVILREVKAEDIEDIYQGAQDPLIPKFTTVPPNYSIDLAKNFVAKAPTSFANQTELIFTIVNSGKENNEKFAGVISLHTIDHGNHRAEIGYWLAKSARGKGVGKTAVELLTEFGLLTIGFKRIEAMVNIENEASRKLLLSAGYEFEGVLRQRTTNHEGKQIDMADFAATKV